MLLKDDDVSRIRRAMNLPARQFAKAVGIGRTTLYRWEVEGVREGVGVGFRVLLWLRDKTHEELRALSLTLKDEEGELIIAYYASRKKPAKMTASRVVA
jgi:DNA-binding XRE family transcriptional regulator